MSPNLEWWAKGVGLLRGGPRKVGAQTWKGGSPKFGAPKGGAPKGGAWGPEGWGPEGWGPEGWGPEMVGPRKVGPKNFALFLPFPATSFLFFFPSLLVFFVKFWWCLKRGCAQMCTFGVLGLSCASPGGPVWWGRRGFTRQPESPNVHILGPRPSKHHQNSTKKTKREGEKNKKLWREREEKERNFGRSSGGAVRRRGLAEGSGGGAVRGRGPGEHTNLGPNTHSRHTQGGPAEPVLWRGGHEEGCPAEGGKWGERTKHSTQHTTHNTPNTTKTTAQQHTTSQQNNTTEQQQHDTTHNTPPHNTQTTQTTQQHTPHTDVVFLVPSSVFYFVPMSFFLSRVFVLFVPFVVFYFVPNVCFFVPFAFFFVPTTGSLFCPIFVFFCPVAFFLSRYRCCGPWQDASGGRAEGVALEVVENQDETW